MVAHDGGEAQSSALGSRDFSYTAPLRMPSLAMALIAFLAGAAPVREESFVLEGRAEVVAAIQAACPGCDWSRPGDEAAVLELRLDGPDFQHLVLTRRGQD